MYHVILKRNAFVNIETPSDLIKFCCVLCVIVFDILMHHVVVCIDCRFLLRPNIYYILLFYLHLVYS